MTAEDFLKNVGTTRSPISGLETYLPDTVKRAMIEFAKYHVKQALKVTSEEVIIEGHPFEYELDKDSILNAYPAENIK